MIFSEKIQHLAQEAEAALASQFKHIEDVAFLNTQNAFQERLIMKVAKMFGQLSATLLSHVQHRTNLI